MGRVMQRSKIEQLANFELYVLRDQYGLLKCFSAVHDAVSDRIDLADRANHTVIRINKHIKHTADSCRML
ncbi:hypothetical protein D3C84_1171670 [compost metagenome]